MKADIAERWACKLESGDYKQGPNFLKATYKDGSTRYCCLGVLVELFLEEGNVLEIRERPHNSTRLGVSTLFEFGIDRTYSHIPVEVSKWADMSSSDGTYATRNRADDCYNLIQDNDTDHDSFDVIAGIIREYKESL